MMKFLRGIVTKKGKTKMKNIYLCGKAGVGKTFACNYVISKYGMVNARVSAPMYDLAYRYFGMKEKDRKLLQVLGTDVARREISNDIWIKRLVEDLYIVEKTREIMNMSKINFIVDDCRFLNEHQAFKYTDWKGIYLHASDEIRIKRLIGRDGDAKIELLNHETESSVDTFKDDLIQVDASGTLDEMYANIDKVIKKEE